MAGKLEMPLAVLETLAGGPGFIIPTSLRWARGKSRMYRMRKNPLVAAEYVAAFVDKSQAEVLAAWDEKGQPVWVTPQLAVGAYGELVDWGRYYVEQSTLHWR